MAIEEQDLPLDLKVYQEQKMKKNSVAVQDGVRDVEIIQLLFKNMT